MFSKEVEAHEHQLSWHQVYQAYNAMMEQSVIAACIAKDPRLSADSIYAELSKIDNFIQCDMGSLDEFVFSGPTENVPVKGPENSIPEYTTNISKFVQDIQRYTKIYKNTKRRRGRPARPGPEAPPGPARGASVFLYFFCILCIEPSRLQLKGGLFRCGTKHVPTIWFSTRKCIL